MIIKLPDFEIKQKIREVKIGNHVVGGSSSYCYMTENNNIAKPLFAYEIPVYTQKINNEFIKDTWYDNSFEQLVNIADNSSADLICIKINSEDDKKDIDSAIKKAVEVSEKCTKPLIFEAKSSKSANVFIINELARQIKKMSIFAHITEESYEKTLPYIISNSHIAVLQSPIDINLAKELNILSAEFGLSLDKILIDTDMGTLGYGLDYGYSIIEKIKNAAYEGDTMLNMPIITFLGEETFKIKETRFNTYDTSYGEYEQRCEMWELTAASALVSAGSDIIVCSNLNTIIRIKEVLCL